MVDLDRLCLRCMRAGVENGVCSHCGAKLGFAQEPVFALPPGSVLHGKYLIGAVLGHGGFGITYIGYDLKDNRRVAIKEYLPDGLANRYPGTTAVSAYHTGQEFYYGLNKFVDEARTVYKYRGRSNIITVYELFEENNTAYYVMEYLDGCDLKRYLQAHSGTLPFDEALRMLLPVFGALEEIHKDGLIHRDISPDNIYVCSNQQVKLLDFGAARVALMDRSKSLSIILKHGYAPEEQYRSKGQQGPWTDVYALGATLYRCVTGKLPPEATERLVNDQLVPPARLVPGIRPAASDAIVRALAVKAGNRFQTVSEFKAALTGAAAPPYTPPVHPPVPAHPVTPAVQAAPLPPATPVIPVPAVPGNPAPNINRRQEQPMSTQAFGKRILAYLIDALLLSAATYLVSALISMSLAGYVVLVYVISVVYGTLMENSAKRATLGKRALGLCVGDRYGSRLSNDKIMIRNLIKYAPTLCIFFANYVVIGVVALVLYGYALIDQARQTLYDKIAGSYVVALEAAHAGAPAARPAPSPYSPSAAPSASINGASLQCVSGHFYGSQFPVKDTVVIGRNPKACSVVLPSDTAGVSGVHCELRLDRSAGGVYLTDKNSTYGTFRNGARLPAGQPVLLRNGDSFTIGDSQTFTVAVQ